jgi:hypothetical protein
MTDTPTREQLIHIGWCPRGEGHVDLPEPDGGGDYQACGSKWIYHAWMTPWKPFDPFNETDYRFEVDETMIERGLQALQRVQPDRDLIEQVLRAALEVSDE